MNTVFRSLGPENFRSVCFRSLRAVRDASGDTSRKHPWIDIDFSELGQKMTPIVGADKRGITRPQLRKLLRFIASHADKRYELFLRGGRVNVISTKIIKYNFFRTNCADFFSLKRCTKEHDS